MSNQLQPHPNSNIESVNRLKVLAKKYPEFVQELAEMVLGHTQFGVWTGSGFPFVHHYGNGGLAQHTREVVEIALQSNQYFALLGKEEPREYIIFLAALFHDIGKLRDYQPKDGNLCITENTEWEKNEKHKSQIHHITQSGIFWSKAVDKVRERYTISEQLHDEVLHAILAHHGLREWGSPVEPKTRAAWILHLSDQMSARVDDCIKERPKK
jgi:3'-5' exoribonuclease